MDAARYQEFLRLKREIRHYRIIRGAYWTAAMSLGSIAWWGVALCLIFGGCGTDGGDCARPAGVYEVRSTVISGTCVPVGQVSVNVLNFDDTPAPNPSVSCSSGGGSGVSPDMCRVTVDQTCHYADSGNVIRNVGAVDWNESGSRGSGTTQTEIWFPSGDYCSATARYTFTRL